MRMRKEKKKGGEGGGGGWWDFRYVCSRSRTTNIMLATILHVALT